MGRYGDSDYGERSDSKGNHPYACENEGCVNGKGFVFTAAPPEWFNEHYNGDTPKHCPQCKQWKIEQEAIGDITVACCLCSYERTISASKRISYHRHKGNWDDHWAEEASKEICRRCKKIPGRYTRVLLRHTEHTACLGCLYDPNLRTYGKREKAVDAKMKQLFDLVLAKGIQPSTPYQVPNNLEFYRNAPDPDHGTVIRHILKPKHEWKEALGKDDPQAVVNIGQRVALSDESHVLEFRLKNDGRVMKYDTHRRVCALIEEDEDSPTGYLVRTTYPKGLKAVIKKIDTGEWKCA